MDVALAMGNRDLDSLQEQAKASGTSSSSDDVCVCVCKHFSNYSF